LNKETIHPKKENNMLNLFVKTVVWASLIELAYEAYMSRKRERRLRRQQKQQH
jgi:hypothetical protein